MPGSVLAHMRVCESTDGTAVARAFGRDLAVRTFVAKARIDIEQDGVITRMPARTLIRGVCLHKACGKEQFATERIGSMLCLHCQGPVKWQWGEGLVAFVPEAQSPKPFVTLPPGPRDDDDPLDAA